MLHCDMLDVSLCYTVICWMYRCATLRRAFKFCTSSFTFIFFSIVRTAERMLSVSLIYLLNENYDLFCLVSVYALSAICSVLIL